MCIRPGRLANQLVGRVDPDEQGIFGIECSTTRS